jgi:hypothetical protein
VTITRNPDSTRAWRGEPRAATSPVGATVHVLEPGRRPWVGKVLGVRLGLRCWYLQIRRDDGRIRSVAAHHVA